MKLDLLAVVLALCVLRSAALEIAAMDCNGGMRMGGFPVISSMQYDLSPWIGLGEKFLSLYKERLQCICPDLTTDEFNRLLHPFFGVEMAMAILNGTDSDLTFSRCSWSAFEDVIIRANKYAKTNFNLPASCTYAKWKQDGTCLLQSTTFSEWDMSIKVGMFRCPNSPWRPAFSFHCEGSGCIKAFTPCNSNSDCPGSTTCQELVINNVVRPNQADMLTALKSMRILDDASSSCADTTSLLTKGLNMFRNMWNPASGAYTFSGAKFCSSVSLNINTNTTGFDWQTLVHYSSSALQYENSSLVALPGYLSSWDGSLNGGSTVTAPSVTISTGNSVQPITPNARVIVAKTCDGTIAMLPKSKYGFQMQEPFMRKGIDFWTTSVLPMLKCRFNALGASISEQELKNRWGLGADLLFFLIDAQQRNPSITLSHILDHRFNMTSRVNLPETCNYNSWVNSGSCRATYTGLSSLLGLDIKVNLVMEKCSGSEDFSIITECVGNACSLLDGTTKPCSSNADCPETGYCMDVNQQTGTYDWISAYVGLNRTRTSCFRTDNSINADLRKLIFTYLGLNYDGSSENKYCAVDYNHVSSQISTWKNGEVETTSPGVITLKNLHSFDIAAGSGTPTVMSTGSFIKVTASMLLLAVAVVFAF